MRCTARKARTESWETFSFESLHIDVPVFTDQQELTYNSSVWTQDVVLKTFREWWVMAKNGNRTWGKSVPAAWLNDDDDEYIYIVIHRQTVSFYQNSSVWLDTQNARSRDRNPSNFTLDNDSDHSSTKRTSLAKGILGYFYFWKQQQQPLFYIFYTLSATRVLNSFEELCITLAAAGNSFARALNPHGGAYIYIYIYIYKVS